MADRSKRIAQALFRRRFNAVDLFVLCACALLFWDGQWPTAIMVAFVGVILADWGARVVSNLPEES